MIIELEVGLSCALGILDVLVYVDNSGLYVLDHHNIGIDDALNVIVSQHLTMVLNVVLTLFPFDKWV